MLPQTACLKDKGAGTPGKQSPISAPYTHTYTASLLIIQLWVKPDPWVQSFTKGVKSQRTRNRIIGSWEPGLWYSLFPKSLKSSPFLKTQKIPVKVKVVQSCLTLCNPMDYGILEFHGILQARTLRWVAFPFSRGSSQPRDWTQVSHITNRFFTSWATREARKSQVFPNSWKIPERN